MSDDLDLDELDGIFDDGDDELPPVFGEQAPAQSVHADIASSQINLKRLSYQWAEDVFWVYQHLSENVKKSAAGHRWHMLQTAKENTRAFQEQTLPKAMLLLDKMLDKDGDSEIVEMEEEQSIAKLKIILRDAIKEALENDQ